MTGRAPTLLQMMTISGHTFIPSGVASQSTAIDLGANAGALEMKRRFRARCIAVEPTPALAAKLCQISGVEVSNCAIADREGEAMLHVSINREKLNLTGYIDDEVTDVVTQRNDGAAHLESARPAAASGRELQALPPP